MNIWSLRAILACLVVAITALDIKAEVAASSTEGIKTVATPSSRIISIGGTVSEIVAALGGESQLVGVDTSSVYPSSLSKLPQIGYQRTLAAEGVLGLQPSIILASSEAGPPAVIKQIQESGVPYITIPIEHTVESTKNSIRLIAKILNQEKKGTELIQKLEQSLKESSTKIATSKQRPKVLFIYARGAGTLNISGRDTAADAMIVLAGGINPVSGYTSYKPMTAEALVTAAPDYILMTSRGIESIGGIDGLLKQSGVAHTPAGKNRRIIVMDDLLLLGFGPRLGNALNELTQSIHASPAALAFKP